MAFLLNQNSFAHGEFANRLIARNDLDIYHKAAWRLRNLVVIPQGGAKKRFGTKYIDTLVGLTENQYMLIPFEYDEADKYVLILTDLNMAIYHNDVKVVDITTPYPGTILENLELKYTSYHQTLIIVHEDYEPRELLRTVPHTGWTFDPISFKNLPTYDFDRNYDTINFNLSAVAVGDGATLTASSAIFTAEYVGGMFIGLGEDKISGYGIARITGYTDTTHVTVSIISKFDSSYTSPQSGKNLQLSIPAWSAIKGWPRTATFFESRLIFGGSKALPEAVFMSVTFDKYNFDTGRGYSDNAIILEIGGDHLSTIRNIVSSNALQIFTTKGEFAAFNPTGQPLQPGLVAFPKQQTGNGCENTQPQVLNNQTFYIKKGGKGVMNFIFVEGSSAYQSLEVSVVSPHLIVNPIDSAVLRGSLTDDANYLLIINSDGTLASYQTLMEEKVSAWTLSDTNKFTNGKFKRIASIGDDIYFLVQREIAGDRLTYLEKLDWEFYTDSSIEKNYVTPTTLISGLDHLEGETVSVTGDGYILADKTVEEGEITIDIASINVKIGLLFEPLLRTLPIAIDTPIGNIAYSKKKIFTVYVDYYDSVGIYINNEVIPFRTFGEDFPYPPPTGQTGIYEHINFGEWIARQYIEITQHDPLPMTILGLGYKIEV